MKKNFKGILVIMIVIFVIVLIDNLQALIFNNSPFFKIIENYNGGNTYRIDRGILVDTYNCVNGKKHTVIKGFSYSCSDSINYVIVDTSKEIENFSCAEALEEIYTDNNYVYYLSCMKSKYIVVRYDGGRQEKLVQALQSGHINIQDLDKFNIEYIRYSK